MKWWVINKHIFIREDRRINEQYKENDFTFYEKKNQLWLEGTLKLPYMDDFISFEFDLKYPINYPFSIPYVYPKDRSKTWIGDHQFLSSGFCLDIREKSWNSTLTASDILLSLEKLLNAGLEQIVKKTESLDVYEEYEPTKLDKIRNNIKAIVPSKFDKKLSKKSGILYYHIPINDSRIIISPFTNFEDHSKEKIKEMLDHTFLKLWVLKVFQKNKCVYIKTSIKHLEKVVHLTNLNDLLNYLKANSLGYKSHDLDWFKQEKITKILFFAENEPIIISELEFKKEIVQHNGSYNFEISLLKSRIESISTGTNLASKKVAIIGCGSAGGTIAEELVKSGVENFILIDDDFLSIENVIRHTCDLQDIGLKKTFAVGKRLRNINPKVSVDSFNIKVEIIPVDIGEALKTCDIIINATASIEELLNHFCWDESIPSIHSKVYPEGIGGEILRIIPKITPCFECLHYSLTNSLEELPRFNDNKFEEFVDYNQTFEGEVLPISALSIDSKFVSLITSKMALEVLEEESLEKLKEKNNAIVWGNKNDWIFSSEFECLKVETKKMESFKNCLVCFGNKQIETELNMTSHQIIEEAKKIEIRDETN